MGTQLNLMNWCNYFGIKSSSVATAAFNIKNASDWVGNIQFISNQLTSNKFISEQLISSQLTSNKFISNQYISNQYISS